MIAYLKGKVIYRDNEKSSIILETNGVGYEVFIPAAGSLNLNRSSGGTSREQRSRVERLKIFGNLSLFIYTYVREDRITLYGFYTSLQREIFSLLLEVKDVGPKLAVTILSGIDANNFLNILTTQDISALSQIKGIGKAKAERIVMELKNKILRKPALINDIKAEDICNYNYNKDIEDITENKTGESVEGHSNSDADIDNNLNFTDSNNILPSDIILESSCALEALGYSRLESFNLASKVYKSIKDEGVALITTEGLTKECLRHIYLLKEAGSADLRFR